MKQISIVFLLFLQFHIVNYHIDEHKNVIVLLVSNEVDQMLQILIDVNH
jgi:hypothetical protein